MLAWRNCLQSVVVAACVAQCSSWSLAPLLGHSSGSTALQLRCSQRAAPTQILMSSQPSENGKVTRQEFVQGLAALVLPLTLGTSSPLPANALGSDVEKKLEAIPLPILQSIAGGSAKEFEEMKDAFKPAKDLQGVELELYKLYRYAAAKAPAMDDPRQSLRGLFISKSGDAMFQYVSESAKLKVYDARGDGLTNGGKGGVLKGTRVLLETLKAKGLITDFSIDSSSHKELEWQQAKPSAVAVSVSAPVGQAASKQLEEEKVGLSLSIAAQALQGYYKQCKISTTPEIAQTAGGEEITLKLAWAGKARQLGTMERRANDKLNAARGYKE